MTYNEIDYLIKLNENLSCVIADLTMQLNTARADAIKEFAERLKEKAHKFTEYDEAGWSMTVYTVKVEDIDNLAKEMVGEGYEREK